MIDELTPTERLILECISENGGSTVLGIAVRALVQPDRTLDALLSLLDKGLIRSVERPKGIERRVYFLSPKGSKVMEVRYE